MSRSVLNVDDDPSALYLRSRVMRQAGFEVVEARTGEEALSLASGRDHSLVVLDVRLPDLNGFAVCRRLKNNPGTKNIPVLHVSAAVTGADDVLVGLEQADGYLVEPVDPRVLAAYAGALIRNAELLEALRQSNEMLTLAQRAANCGAWTWNLTTGEMAWSPEYRELCGLDPAGVAPSYENWLNSVHPDDREMVHRAVQQAIRSRQELRVEFRLMKPGGMRWLAGLGRPYCDNTGAPVLMSGLSIDITAKKEAELERERLLESAREDIKARQRVEAELSRSNQELAEFAYAVSHDLQEPLRGVASLGALLACKLSGRLEPETESILQTMLDSTGRMQALIRDLLSYSQASHGLHESRGRVDMGGLMSFAVSNLGEALRGTGGEITWEELPAVAGTFSRLVQLMQNLLENAIKYRCPDRPPRIRVSAERNGAFWLFRVQDNGIGIEPEFHEQIFGVFKRLHGRSVPGTGIGLALCRKIVERMGGRIWVESQPGVGSTFCFTLAAEAEVGIGAGRGPRPDASLP